MEDEITSLLREHGFLIREKIGIGGSACVFKVVWEKYPSQLFAAKVIKASAGYNSHMINSFHTEIQILQKLFHKNIILIFHHFITQKYMVIIMEYCSNGSLADTIGKSGPLDESRFRGVAHQIISALEFCHSNNIAHRDIKTSNILLDERNRLKLCDFGISEISDNDCTTRHDGSLPFAAPEMLGMIPYDPKKADIWALGITFYMILTGKLPWDMSCKRAITQDILTFRPYFNGMFSPTLRDLLCKMLCSDPSQRISALEVLKHPFFTQNKPRGKIRGWQTSPDELKLIKKQSFHIPLSVTRNKITSCIASKPRGMIIVPKLTARLSDAGVNNEMLSF